MSHERREGVSEEVRTRGSVPDAGLAETLARRTRLRTRILGFSLLYAVLLLAVAAGLTWSARRSQQELGTILDRDLRASGHLEELVRAQNEWLARWSELSAAQDGRLVEWAGRYHDVAQMVDSHALRAIDVGSLPSMVARFRSAAERSAEQWRGASREERAAMETTLRESSHEISAAAFQTSRKIRSDADRRLFVLEQKADGLMLTAIGIAWIIGIVTIGTARMAMAKIVRPLEELSRAATVLAQHPVEAPLVAVAGDREVATLAHNFNRMIGEIRERDDELRRIAATDELTGMNNFRAFERQLKREIARSDRYGHSFGLLVFDLDHFKKYNDRHGHLAGNHALVAVATAIRETLRDTDFPARYGGEEFAAIVPEIDGAGLAHLAERIRVTVESLEPIDGRSSLTCSIGGAMFPDDGRVPSDLFSAADRRLYQAKDAGRNRTIVGAAPVRAAGARGA